MQTFSAELAEEILTKFKERGWCLYPAEISKGMIDPEATIRNRPAEQLEKGCQYVILPEVDNPADSKQISKTIGEIIAKIKSPPSLPHGPGGIILESIILREEDVAIPGRADVIMAMLYNPFMNALDKFFNRNSPRQINYTNIDASIRDLIYKLNKVSFVGTIKCKAARLWNEEMESKGGWIRADDGCCFIAGAYLLFDVEEHPSAEAFMTDVASLLSNYSFAKIADKKGHKKMIFTCDDITQIDKMQEEEDPVVNALLRIKYSHQATKEKGRKRMQDFQEIRDELVRIAEKYTK